MSQKLCVTSENIPTILKHLTAMIPKGDTAVNMTIKIANGGLYFICRSNIWYKASLGKVNASDFSLTVRYYDLSALFKSDSKLDIELFDTYVQISTDNATVTLDAAYDFEDLDFEIDISEELNKVNKETAFDMLRSFLQTTAIFNLYKTEHPYQVYNNIILLKTPSIWFQGRCELNLNASITVTMLRTLLQLEPGYYYTKDKSLYITDKFYIGVIPIQPLVEQNNFTEILDGISEPVTIDTGNFAETLNTIIKIKPPIMEVAVYDNGMSITASTPECSIKNKIGMCDNVKFICKIPPELLQIVFKLLHNNTTAQILYKKGIICYRNKQIVILIRVIS